MINIEVFKKHLREKRAVKIIAGMNNFDIESVKRIANAAQMGIASALEVAASKEIIKAAKSIFKKTVFASSVYPYKLKEAVEAGADAIQIGNFRELYNEGIFLNSDDVYEIVVETMDLISKYDVFVSVTIPWHLSIDDKIDLAKKVELLGVDLIETEGNSSIKPNGMVGLFDAAKSTILDISELSRHVGINVIATGNLTPETIPLALASGAVGVGVGGAVNRLDTQVGMISMVRSIVASANGISTNTYNSIKSEVLI